MIISLHWIGGRLYFQVRYTVEAERVMNETEQQIAAAVKKETGMAIHVEIIPEGQLNAESFGYSGQFIFTREIDGATYFFRVIDNPVETVSQEYTVYNCSDPDCGPERLFPFQRLFSKFTVQEQPFPLASKDRQSPRNLFHYNGIRDIFQPSIPTPPPWRI